MKHNYLLHKTYFTSLGKLAFSMFRLKNCRLIAKKFKILEIDNLKKNVFLVTDFNESRMKALCIFESFFKILISSFVILKAK